MTNGVPAPEKKQEETAKFEEQKKYKELNKDNKNKKDKQRLTKQSS